ncbi:hypothetical protein [Anaerosporobacter sp.]|uniref:hypothetical protein n=1 Tax=Anaerosporobacter sp. TaxID=1872529 RepID=UPI00286F7EAA|nr:hypothetical protein [Anaerosporobacter sp.]
MGYEDEIVIEAMNAYKVNERGDIYKGVYIKEELFEFERQELFEGTMSIMLPKKFIDMPYEYAKIKYPSENRPEIIKTNEMGDVNFTFSVVDTILTNEMVKEAKEGMRMIIKRIQPANVFFDNEEMNIWEDNVAIEKESIGTKNSNENDAIEERECITIGWFDFKSHGLDEKIYQFWYCFPMEGKMVHGIFNCIYSDHILWKPLLLQVIQSIRDETKQ